MASGLAFGIKKGFVGSSRSLNNIIKELEDDTGFNMFQEYSLEHWAAQGVLLLNTALTVRVGLRDSHKQIGWHLFVESVIEKLHGKKVVLILWGDKARVYLKHHDIWNHAVIESSHPSPLSWTKGTLPFKGSKPFTRCNTYLEEMELDPIDWFDHSMIEEQPPWDT